MAKKRIEAAKLMRLEARARVIKGAGKLALIAFCLSLGFVVIASAVPQKRALDKLNAKLKLVKEQERLVSEEQEHRRIELRALREDPAYLEIHARDRLDYARDGERVLRFKRDH